MKTWEDLKDAFETQSPRLIPSACATALASRGAVATHGGAFVSAGQEAGLFFKEKFLPIVNRPHPDQDRELDRYFGQAFSRFTQLKLTDFFADPIVTSAEGFVNPSFDGIMATHFVELFLSLFPDRTIKDYNTRFFAGKKDHLSNLHFDWKSQANVLFQITGKKEIHIYHPRHSLQLGLAGNLSSKILGHIDIRPDHVFILCPGDAVFIPAFYWHEVLVLEDSTSLSFRAFSDPLLGYLTDNLSPTHLLVEAFDQYLSGRCERNELLQQVKTYCSQDTAVRLGDYKTEINRLWRYGYEKYAMPRLLSNQGEIKRLNEAPYMNVIPFERHLSKLWE